MYALIIAQQHPNDVSPGQVGLSFVCLGFAAVLYFLPCVVAGARGHPSGAAIMVVNVFFGWTLIGWVVALAWALAGFEPPRRRRSRRRRDEYDDDEDDD